MKGTKVKGEEIGKYENFVIKVVHNKPKHRGKERIWFAIRQKDPKKWRQSIAHAYPKGLDVQFVKE